MASQVLTDQVVSSCLLLGQSLSWPAVMTEILVLPQTKLVIQGVLMHDCSFVFAVSCSEHGFQRHGLTSVSATKQVCWQVWYPVHEARQGRQGAASGSYRALGSTAQRGRSWTVGPGRTQMLEREGIEIKLSTEVGSGSWAFQGALAAPSPRDLTRFRLTASRVRRALATRELFDGRLGDCQQIDMHVEPLTTQRFVPEVAM